MTVIWYILSIPALVITCTIVFCVIQFAALAVQVGASEGFHKITSIRSKKNSE